MFGQIAAVAATQYLANPAQAKAMARAVGGKLLGFDGEPDPIVPRWVWPVSAGLGGLLLGVYLAQKWPRAMPRIAPRP